MGCTICYEGSVSHYRIVLDSKAEFVGFDVDMDSKWTCIAVHGT